MLIGENEKRGDTSISLYVSRYPFFGWGTLALRQVDVRCKTCVEDYIGKNLVLEYQITMVCHHCEHEIRETSYVCILDEDVLLPLWQRCEEWHTMHRHCKE